MISLAVALLGGGCASTGPVTVPADRFNYNKAGAESTKEQLLLNIVRLRYHEPIYVLEIGSMISNHRLAANGSLSGWSNNLNELENPVLMAMYGNDKHASWQRNWDAGFGYTDSPTITYTPVQGEKFASRMMTAIPNTMIFQLAQSGWGMDQLFDCCVQWINGIPNASVGIRESKGSQDPRFRRVATLLRTFQDTGMLVFVVEMAPEGGKAVHLRTAPGQHRMEAERVELRELLGYTEGPVPDLKLVPSPFRVGSDELAIQTRSLLGVMWALSRGVTVPEEHIKLGWTEDDHGHDEGEEQEAGWLQVGCSVLPRSHSFVQVRYKGYWFYIDESDATSKRTFALLDYLFALQQTEKGENLPLVTVPAR